MSEPQLPRRTWIDNHCHLDEEADLSSLLTEARSVGVAELVCVGVDVERSLACVELATDHSGVWATAGVHPHQAAEHAGPAGLDGLRDVVAEGCRRGVLVAVGECGLDHHYDHSPRDAQRGVFAAQIDLANELDLPLVVHTREAWEETFDVLDAEGTPRRTVFHCFTGGPHEAAESLSRGALLSVSGIATFASASALREAVATAPLERLMVETDSPYLAPVPHRGRRNRPAHVGRVGEEVALLQGRSPDEVAAATVATTERFYGLRDLDAERRRVSLTGPANPPG